MGISVALLWIAVAHADGDMIARRPGSELLALCSVAEADVTADARATTCIAFVEGFLWGHGWAAWRNARDMYFCPPHPMSGRDLLPAVLAYLRAHPARLDQPSHLLLFSALSSAYPCSPADDASPP
jgi:hypothetical protein